ncbi:MAG: hypothetical protein ACKVOR_01275 [Flavobacteriales bacterium]
MFRFCDKNILIISPESWGKSLLSKHHYALELVARGNRVWFLNSPFHKKDEVAQLAEAHHTNLHILDEPIHKGLTKWPQWLQRIVIRHKVRRLLARAGVSFHAVWSFDNSRYFLLDEFTGAIKIHHVVDTHMNYSLREACSSANVCLAVTDELVSRCAAYNTNAHFVQHGFAPFSNTALTLHDRGYQTHACYVGNLLMHAFDPTVIATLANKFPAVCFHLIGNTYINHLSTTIDPMRATQLEALRPLPNVVFYGELPYEEAFTLAAQCDVLLLMYFNKTEIIGNSSKLLTYLSTGKVILADDLSGHQASHLLLSVQSREEYVSKFEHTIRNLAELNNKSNSSARKLFAEQHTYSKQVERIETIISNTLAP